MPSACVIIPKLCCQICIACSLTAFVPGFLRRPFTVAQIMWSSPTASPLNAPWYFLTMLWLMASNIMPPARSDVTGCHSFTYLSQGCIQSTHTENYSKFSNSTKTFNIPVYRYGWHACGGSTPGQGNARIYGMICMHHIQHLNILSGC
jgi:hypothetical protein